MVATQIHDLAYARRLLSQATTECRRHHNLIWRAGMLARQAQVAACAKDQNLARSLAREAQDILDTSPDAHRRHELVEMIKTLAILGELDQAEVLLCGLDAWLQARALQHWVPHVDSDRAQRFITKVLPTASWDKWIDSLADAQPSVLVEIAEEFSQSVVTRHSS